jgi:hypothetical protein
MRTVCNCIVKKQKQKYRHFKTEQAVNLEPHHHTQTKIQSWQLLKDLFFLDSKLQVTPPSLSHKGP